MGVVPRDLEGVRGGEMERAAQRSVIPRRVVERVGLVRVVGRTAHPTLATSKQHVFMKQFE
jgi:hypothetical protein